jgi:hypothetical protein
MEPYIADLLAGGLALAGQTAPLRCESKWIPLCGKYSISTGSLVSILAPHFMKEESESI